MSDENKKNKKPRKITVFKVFKIFLVLILMVGIVGGGIVAGIVLSIVKDAPEIDPSNINATLAQTSSIYDSNGVLIEKIQAPEFRTVVSLNKMPKHLQDAFIAIEDERFETHIGVDPKGIVSSLLDNIKAGATIRGASTITQQLARNLYLNDDVKISRKITEAYLALKMERVLSKDQILEAYLNRSSFGQNAYGVQEAARTYFSKDVEELTIAESAVLAGIVKGPTIYQPYKRVRPDDFDSEKQFEVGQIDVLGEKYIVVYNEKSVERQKIILNKMLSIGKITQSQYDEAIREDIKLALKPEQKKNNDITSYFTDYVKTTSIQALVDKLGYTSEKAEELLFSGGLHIYSTMDIVMQKTLEDVYDNFTEILVGNTEKIKGPILVDWRLSKAGNILDDKNNIIYYSKNNLITEDYQLIVDKGSYELANGNLLITNNKLAPYAKHIDVADYYTIDDRKNLVTYTVGSIILPEDEFSIEGKTITFSKTYLDKNPDFYTTDENGNLLISDKFFYIAKDGIVQPQSATATIDYTNGHIKALVGGRDVEGNRIWNRATSPRQPGSAIKPIAVYLPALDNGYTAGSAIDDIPFYNSTGELWPKNWYTGYRGIHSLRRSVEQSVNVNSVKTLQNIGIKTSMSYLEKMGIINTEHPERDNIVTSSENRVTNDENLSSLGLGGMTKGLSPLEITAAFGTIANNGVYVEPIAFTKIVDKNGNILLDNTPKENIVVSPQIAYILKDILRTTVTDGLAGRAKVSNMVVAGKTGTTQNQADIWFVGITPYYVTGTWIGNDSPKITLTKSSSTAAQLWQHINTKIHDGLESKTSFIRPEGIVSVNICSQSGLLATELCTQDPRGVVRTEIFAAGTVPKAYCEMHVALTIDTSNNKIANEYCPEDLVAQRVYIQRTPPYNPADHNGIVPSDYQYNAPTEVCTDHDETTVVPDDPFEDFWEWWNNNNGSNNNNETVVPLDPLDNDDD